jgi:hypothetical protein
MNIPRVVKWISGGALLGGGLEKAGLRSGMLQTGEVGELEFWLGSVGIVVGVWCCVTEVGEGMTLR